MSFNTFGHLFRVTTFGESHGPAIGCVVDGCPPGIALTEADIQADLDRRRPGQSKFVTQRQEPDTVKILSGVFQDERMAEQVTTGTPIALLIENVDQRSKDYTDIRDKFRPGHADYTYLGQIRRARLSRRRAAERARDRDARRGRRHRAQGAGLALRQGRRSAARWCRWARKTIDRANWNWDEVARNPFFCPDAKAVAPWTEYLEGMRKKGSSVGAIIEVVAEGIPAGLGAPVYAKLDGDLAAAMMSINAVKGVEIGDGFATAAMTRRGKCRRDARGHMTASRDSSSNHAGGILGGISTGQPIVARFAVKPTSSILSPRKTIDIAGSETEIAPRAATIPASASAPCRSAKR